MDFPRYGSHFTVLPPLKFPQNYNGKLCKMHLTIKQTELCLCVWVGYPAEEAKLFLSAWYWKILEIVEIRNVYP